MNGWQKARLDLLACAEVNIKLEYFEKIAESLVALVSCGRSGAAPVLVVHLYSAGNEVTDQSDCCHCLL